jgi:threonylcarbamoyladenosine tRNA methylthiotransferase MtaB
MNHVVPLKVRAERSKMLRNLSEKKRREFYQENMDKTYEVLFEEDIEEGYMHGFTENYIRVAAKYDPLLINELKKVKLKEIGKNGNVEVEEPDYSLQDLPKVNV